MIAQLLLTGVLASTLLYAWMQYSRSPLVGLLAAVGSLTGLYFVWAPSHATAIAETVGIGRGADLVLYTWVGISFIVLLNLHLKMRTQLELITQLARALTILHAESREAKPASPEDAEESAASRQRSKSDAPQ